MTYWLLSKSVPVRLGMNRSDADAEGVRRVGVIDGDNEADSGTEKSRPGDFFGVLDGVFRTRSHVRFFPADGMSAAATRDAEKSPTGNSGKRSSYYFCSSSPGKVPERPRYYKS